MNRERMERLAREDARNGSPEWWDELMEARYAAEEAKAEQAMEDRA